MKKVNDPKIVYQGIYLLYRLSSEDENIRDYLKNFEYRIDYYIFVQTLQIVKKYADGQAFFHSKSHKVFEINNPQVFVEFASLFLKY